MGITMRHVTKHRRGGSRARPEFIIARCFAGGHKALPYDRHSLDKL